MKSTFSFTGTCKLTLSYEKGATTSQHETTDIRLDVSDNQKNGNLIGIDDLPTKEGVKPLTQCFIQGLVANIHASHEKGYWNDAEHLRYIITELQRGFVEISNISESTM